MYGVVFDIPDADLRILDRKEGAPNFYRRCPINVRFSNEGGLEEVLTYEVVEKEGFAPPTREYLDIIIRGAESHKLPPSWIVRLRSFGV